MLLYTLKSNKINSISPGVFFYYSRFATTAPLTSSNTIKVTEDKGAWSRAILAQNISNVKLYDSTCMSISATITVGSDGSVTLKPKSTLPAGIYIIGVKYDPGSLKGFTPVPASNSYSFQTELNASVVPNTIDSIAVQKKP